MTIKGKRARSLPIMDGPTWSTGGFVDESVPDAARELIQLRATDFGSDFLDWFPARLGRYRAFCELHDLPTVTQELALVREAQRYLLETRQRLENLPPTADAYINEATWRRHDRLFHCGVLDDFESLSREIDTLLAIAEQKLDQLPKKAGRKAKTNRDELLADVSGRLASNGLSKRAAAELAAELLTASGVEAPNDLVEVERICRRSKRVKIDPN